MAPDKKRKSNRTWMVTVATAFILSWLGLLFMLFPIGNPLKTVGGTSGEGLVYAVLFGVILMLAILLYYSVRSSLKDVLQSIGNELGIDIDEISSQYKQILKDEYLIMTGKKEKISDHHDEG